MPRHTEGQLSIKRSPTPDNVGGHDYAIYDENNYILAETYEIVGGSIGARVRMPAEANARLFANAANAKDALRSLANEAAGFLSMADRERHGHTNCACLQDRIDQARAVLASIDMEASSHAG